MILSATLPLLLAAATFQPTTTFKTEGLTGRVQFEAGVLSAPYTQRLEDAARAYVQTRKDLGLPSGATLGTAKIFGTRFGASVHLPELINGVEVDGASVVVTFDNDKRVVQVASGLLTFTSFTTFTLTSQAAMDKAGRGIDGAMIRDDGRFYGATVKRYFVIGDEARAGYLVFSPTLFPNENWYSAIDAVTGEVLFKQNRVFHAANDAQVYARDPGGLDGGVGKTATVAATLGNFKADAGSTLSGDRIVAWGCCTSAFCDGGVPARISGTLNYGGFNVQYDAGICDRVQRASNDPLVHGSGDFVYTPVDPPAPICTAPNACKASSNDPADQEEFAEVNAYYHLNSIYDFVRTLSSNVNGVTGDTVQPFDLKDVKNGGQTQAWANITIPNRAELESNVNPFVTPITTHSDTLSHVDNAAFMPKENFQDLFLPASYSFTNDAFMLFQGDYADFTYDAPVVWHEFGHGMMHSVPGLAFSNVIFDSRSANNEVGAIHEGMADWLAAAYGQNPAVGNYTGPRMFGANTNGGPLRSADNTFKCPDVLWGEVHQDGMHMTGAIWEARRELFQGTDNGRTFDTVVYAALASLPPSASFSLLANAIAAKVQTAFPAVSQAQTKIQAIFDSRGVTNCSKILDVTNLPIPQRDIFIIADRQQAGLPSNQFVPGPFQFKFAVPNGAKSVSIVVPVSAGNPFQQPTAPPVRLLAKDQAITFTKTTGSVTHNATGSQAFALGGNNTGTAKVNIDIPCGGELYVALAASAGTQLTDLRFTVEPATSCGGGTDAGTSDAGTPDAGTTVIPSINEGGSGGGGAAAKACGCDAVGSGVFGFVALLGLMRRRRR